MSTPQTENGYIKIATGNTDNDIVRALVNARLNGAEWEAIMIILRKTWGFKKKEDSISFSQFTKFGSRTKQTYFTATRSLLLKKIITVKKSLIGNLPINTYSFNKNFSEWKLLKKTILLKKTNKTIKETSSKLLKKTLNTKESITKESIQKKVDPPAELRITEEDIKVLKETYVGEVEAEALACVSWWNELNQTKTNRKWQYEKTFELRRRLATWFGRSRCVFRKGSLDSLAYFKRQYEAMGHNDVAFVNKFGDEEGIKILKKIAQ